MGDQIDVLGEAWRRTVLRYSSSERTGSYVILEGKVGDRSMLWVSLLRIGRVPQCCTQRPKVPILAVTSEAFLRLQTVCGWGNQCGNEVTNFHRRLDRFNLVHEAMKSKSGATHLLLQHLQHLATILACISAPSTPPRCKISA